MGVTKKRTPVSRAGTGVGSKGSWCSAGGSLSFDIGLHQTSTGSAGSHGIGSKDPGKNTGHAGIGMVHAFVVSVSILGHLDSGFRFKSGSCCCS